MLDANGTGLTSDVISAIEYATEHKDSLGIDIINLSLGHPIYEPAASDPLVQAVEAAVSRRNRRRHVGRQLRSQSGDRPSGIRRRRFASQRALGDHRRRRQTSDTNTRRDDRVAPYSSRGPTWYDGIAKPDLVAPGHGIVSVAAHNSTLYLNNPGLQRR